MGCPWRSTPPGSDVTVTVSLRRGPTSRGSPRSTRPRRTSRGRQPHHPAASRALAEGKRIGDAGSALRRHGRTPAARDQPDRRTQAPLTRRRHPLSGDRRPTSASRAASERRLRVVARVHDLRASSCSGVSTSAPSRQAPALDLAAPPSSRPRSAVARKRITASRTASDRDGMAGDACVTARAGRVRPSRAPRARPPRWRPA